MEKHQQSTFQLSELCDINPSLLSALRQGQPEKSPKSVYAFIDTANLHQTTLKHGWQIDWRKFRVFLRQEYGVAKAFQFMGLKEECQAIYERLDTFGYELVHRPVTEYADGTQKANIDAWLIVKCFEEMGHCQQVVLVAGDGDYLPLCDYLVKRNRLLKIVVPSASDMSWMFSQYRNFLFFVDKHRKKFEFFPRRPRRPRGD